MVVVKIEPLSVYLLPSCVICARSAGGEVISIVEAVRDHSSGIIKCVYGTTDI